jgi:hypothetical protein
VPGYCRLPSGRSRLQRRRKHGAQGLRRSAAKPLDVPGQNIERTRREGLLDAELSTDGTCRQAGLRQSGTQLLLGDDAERDRRPPMSAISAAR